MKKLLCLLALTCALLQVHAQSPASASQSPVEVLSDTTGANIMPYIKNMMSDLRARWVSLVAGEAQKSPTRQDETVISFTIAPDGHLLAMKLVSSTHNDAVNRAAWNAIRGATFAATPSGMKDPDLSLRIRFVINAHPDHF